MASLRSTLLLGIALSSMAAFASSAQWGLVEHTNAHNRALLVGVSHGLPGIDLDVNNVDSMTGDPAYHFQSTKLMDEQGTVAGIAEKLTALSKDAGQDGTFLFYYSGHGGEGTIWPEDDTMEIGQIRDAIRAGREAGPLARLVLIFDSCYSGSLLDPMRHPLSWGQTIDARTEAQMNEAFVDQVTRVMGAGSFADAPYWNKLFVFASSRADETSMAGSDGSVFTVAMHKAFQEVMAANSTVGEFIEKSQQYTVGHHPVARLVPTTLSDEKMKP